MSDSFFMSFSKFFVSIIIFSIIICIFFIPIINSSTFSLDNYLSYTDTDDTEYLWPTPGYTKINSYFGKRISPTAMASSFHKGIDIGAPEGSCILAITSRTNYVYWFFRWWWIYYHFNKWKFKNYLLSCVSKFYCKSWRLN